MSMCVVNYACLWQVLPSHKVSLPTFGQHASHTGAACACAAAVWVCGCWCRLHTYYKHVQLQMPWLKKWWRMQWDVICMVICQTPWSKWLLNVHTVSKYSCKLVPIIVCWCASQGAVKPSMLDGVDVVLLRTTIQVPLLVLLSCLGNHMLALPPFSHKSCNWHDVGLIDLLNLSIWVSGGQQTWKGFL